jgi:hypothetical protein
MIDEKYVAEMVERIRFLEITVKKQGLLLEQQGRCLEVTQSRVAEQDVARMPEPKCPTPERFGGARDNVKNFVSAVKKIFSLQASRFANDSVKIVYISTLLVGDVHTWYRSIEDSDGAELRNLNFFF